jgi:hypothetical protein
MVLIFTTRISVICGGQKRPEMLKKRPEKSICGGFRSGRINAGCKLCGGFLHQKTAGNLRRLFAAVFFRRKLLKIG